MRFGRLRFLADQVSLKAARLHLDALGATSLDALQAVPVQALLDAQVKVGRQLPETIAAAPWFDGTLLPASLAAARVAPTSAIPLLAGFNRDEIRFFEMARGVADLFLSREDMTIVLRRQLGDADAARILAAYPDSKEGTRHRRRALPLNRVGACDVRLDLQQQVLCTRSAEFQVQMAKERDELISCRRACLRL